MRALRAWWGRRPLRVRITLTVGAPTRVIASTGAPVTVSASDCGAGGTLDSITAAASVPVRVSDTPAFVAAIVEGTEPPDADNDPCRFQ